jgi:hypothetical protein
MSARSAPPPSSRSHCLRLDPAFSRLRAISSGRGLHSTVLSRRRLACSDRAELLPDLVTCGFSVWDLGGVDGYCCGSLGRDWPCRGGAGI